MVKSSKNKTRRTRKSGSNKKVNAFNHLFHRKRDVLTLLMLGLSAVNILALWSVKSYYSILFFIGVIVFLSFFTRNIYIIIGTSIVCSHLFETSRMEGFVDPVSNEEEVEKEEKEDKMNKEGEVETQNGEEGVVVEGMNDKEKDKHQSGPASLEQQEKMINNMKNIEPLINSMNTLVQGMNTLSGKIQK
jgi:hypothetical protein